MSCWAIPGSSFFHVAGRTWAGFSRVTSMELPLRKCHRPAARVAANRSTLLGKRILLVDDQRPVRDSINLLLGLDGHTVVGAANGVEALALFKPDHFDLVITDFETPQMNGNELATRIKQVSPSQPILMVTAYAERLGNADNPVDAVLSKPFQLETLCRTMAQLLG